METKDQLVNHIKEWLSIDEEIKLLKKEIKSRQEKKKNLTSDLVEVMKSNEIDAFDNIIDQLFNDLSYDPRFSLMNTNNVSNYYNENEKEYYLTMDVPGMSKDDIEVTFDSNRLKISGQRKSDKYDSYEYGKMERTFSVPSNVETDKISAKIDNGVLKVLLPKAKSSLGRKISVK